MKIKQKYTPVRFSHLTSYAGVGAIVRGAEDLLMVVPDTRYWTDKKKGISAEVIPYVTRVTMALGIDKELRMPPEAKETDKGIKGSYLPAVLFPRFAVCKKCGLLHNNPWRQRNIDLKNESLIICEDNGCTGKVEQVTWCAVSSQGHLADVPWHFLCHQESQKKCEADFNTNYLRLIINPNGKRKIKCKKCGSENIYEYKKDLRFISQQQPWIYGESPKLEEEDVVEILEVNNPGVYLPKRKNALVIPPESRISKTSVVARLHNNSKLCREIDSTKIPLRKKSKLQTVASEFKCSVEEIKEALKEIKAGYPNFDNFAVGDLYEDEYKAFLYPLDNQKDDEDFVTLHKSKKWENLLETDLPNEISAIVDVIDQLVIAKRLREIQVFKGFYRRLEKKDNLVPPDINGESSWLPAIELFGEGVFFTLSEEILSKWENEPAVKKRANEINKLYEKSEVNLFQDIEITPRFILLHTLAHLLIRELEATAGYPAASLSERIYSSRTGKMSGILIFTTVADIAGSLGGIIESAEPKTFLSIMDGVFKKAQWCSLDPVCTEHEGQGPGGLNRAACHACSLIPEPSCDYGNVFLDRVFIKGSKSLDIPNFLEYVQQNNNKE